MAPQIAALGPPLASSQFLSFNGVEELQAVHLLEFVKALFWATTPELLWWMNMLQDTGLVVPGVWP